MVRQDGDSEAYPSNSVWILGERSGNSTRSDDRNLLAAWLADLAALRDSPRGEGTVTEKLSLSIPPLRSERPGIGNDGEETRKCSWKATYKKRAKRMSSFIKQSDGVGISLKSYQKD